MKKISKFIQLAKEALLRYPLIIGMSLISTIYAISEIVNVNMSYSEDFIASFFLSFAIAAPLLIAVTILSDKHQWSRLYFWLAKSAGALLIVISILVLSHHKFEDDYRLIFSVGAIIATSLFFLFLSPYRRKNEEYGFWNFNQKAFIRCVIALAFASIIFGGIAAAYAIIDELFSFDIDGDVYSITSAIIYFLAVPWSFVALIPRNYAACNQSSDYPLLFKILGKYILLILLAIYVVILYVYGAKIVVTSKWPEGVVAYMIMGVSLLGLVTLFILYPLIKEGKSKFMKRLPLIYHIVILPLLLLYFMGILMRISDYGYTLNRYFLVAFGIWQTLVALYFIIGKRDIRFPFIALLFFILVTLFSPWNAFKVCEKSQMNRFMELLNDKEFLVDGKLKSERRWVKNMPDNQQTPEQNESSTDDAAYHLEPGENVNAELLTSEEEQELRSIVKYVCKYHNIEQLLSIFTAEIPLTDSYWDNKNRILNALGIAYHFKSDDTVDFSYDFDFTHSVVSTTGYDYVVLFDYMYQHRKEEYVGQDFTIGINLKDDDLVLTVDDERLVFELSQIVEWAEQRDDFETNESMNFNEHILFAITTKNGDYEISLDPKSISWEYNWTSQQLIAERLYGRLLIKKL